MSVIGDFKLDTESEPLNKGREGHSLPQLAQTRGGAAFLHFITLDNLSLESLYGSSFFHRPSIALRLFGDLLLASDLKSHDCN